MADKKPTDNVKKDLAEIKLTVAILQEQLNKLTNFIVSNMQQPMYTQEELHEIAEYRRKK